MRPERHFGDLGYPINNALSPPATGCDIIVIEGSESRHPERVGKNSGL